jgi:hypothetical protein
MVADIIAARNPDATKLSTKNQRSCHIFSRSSQKTRPIFERPMTHVNASRPCSIGPCTDIFTAMLTKHEASMTERAEASASNKTGVGNFAAMVARADFSVLAGLVRGTSIVSFSGRLCR